MLAWVDYFPPLNLCNWPNFKLGDSMHPLVPNLSNEIGWLYKKPKYLNQSVLQILQKELKVLLDKVVENNLNLYIDKLVSEKNYEVIKTTCPNLIKFLKISKLDRFSVQVCYLISNSNHNSIHIDEGTEGYALNIPIQNCENTCTVWYQAHDRIGDAQVYATDTWEQAGAAPIFDRNSSVEIDRINSNIPHWVNIHVPHSIEQNHNDLRINSSIRFGVGIKEYLKTNYQS